MGNKITVQNFPEELLHMMVVHLDLQELMAVCGSCRDIRRKILECPYKLRPSVPLDRVAVFKRLNARGKEFNWFSADRHKYNEADILESPGPSNFVRVVDDFANLFKPSSSFMILVEVMPHTPFSIKANLADTDSRLIDQRNIMCELNSKLGPKWGWNIQARTTDDLFYHPKTIISASYKSKWRQFAMMEKRIPRGIEAIWLATVTPMPEFTRRFTINRSERLLNASANLCRDTDENNRVLEEMAAIVSSEVSLPCCLYEEYEIRMENFLSCEYFAPKLNTVIMYDGMMFPHSPNVPLSSGIHWNCVMPHIYTETLRLYWVGVTLGPDAATDAPKREKHGHAYQRSFEPYQHLKMKTFCASLPEGSVDTLDFVFVCTQAKRAKILKFFQTIRETPHTNAKNSSWTETLLPAQVHSTQYWKKKWETEVFKPARARGIQVCVKYI